MPGRGRAGAGGRAGCVGSMWGGDPAPAQRLENRDPRGCKRRTQRRVGPTWAVCPRRPPVPTPGAGRPLTRPCRPFLPSRVTRWPRGTSWAQKPVRCSQNPSVNGPARNRFPPSTGRRRNVLTGPGSWGRGPPSLSQVSVPTCSSSVSDGSEPDLIARAFETFWQDRFVTLRGTEEPPRGHHRTTSHSQPIPPLGPGSARVHVPGAWGVCAHASRALGRFTMRDQFTHPW